jgi:hypothetical protein
MQPSKPNRPAQGLNTDDLVLISWAGGFALAQCSKVTPRFLRLELRKHPRKPGSPRWSIRCWSVTGKPEGERRLRWELFLPVKTEAAAGIVFTELHHALAAHRASRRKAPPQPTAEPNLTESQLRFLAKSYPRTVGLWRSVAQTAGSGEQPRLAEALRQAFVEESFALSKVALEPVQDGDQILRMARAFTRWAARKKRKPDPVELELILGCWAKGYWRMPWPQLVKTLGEVAGYEPTVEALRKKWKRLALPSRRRRGRPSKATGK